MRVDSNNTQVDTSQQVKFQANDVKKVSSVGDDQLKVTNDGIRNLNDNKYTKDEMSISEKTIIDTIEKANKAIDGPNKRFEFSIHKGTHEIVVKVLNNDTGEVLKEFPSEKILDMVAKMWEMAGIVVDERR